MTHIPNFTSYKSFPHIYALGKDFVPVELGIYDPEYGTGDNIQDYQSGKFKDYKDEPLYDDARYEGKRCLMFFFKDKLFGNYPGLRKLSDGHYHIKYIVGTNNVSIHDCYSTTPEGDIILYATLTRSPPISFTGDEMRGDGDKTQYTLVEVEPHLNSRELKELTGSIGFVTKLKEQYSISISKQQELEAECFLANSMSLATRMSVLVLEDRINALTNHQNMLLDKYLNLQLSANTKLVKGIESIESAYNFALPWGQILVEDTEKSVASIQTEIRALRVMLKENQLSDNQKQIMVQMVVNACGIDYVRKMVGMMDVYTVGSQTIPMLQKPNLTTLLMQYGQLRDNGTMSAKEYAERVTEILEKYKNDISTSDNSNSAVDKLKQMVLTPSQSEQQHELTQPPTGITTRTPSST